MFNIKVLRLSSHSLNKFTSGEIINIFSNDASQIETAINTIHYLFVSDPNILYDIHLFKFSRSPHLILL